MSAGKEHYPAKGVMLMDMKKAAELAAVLMTLIRAIIELIRILTR